MDNIGIYNAMHVDGRVGKGFKKIIDDINNFGYNKIIFFNEWEGIFSVNVTTDEFSELKKILKEKNVIFYLLCGVEFQDYHKDKNKYGDIYDDNFVFLEWPTFLLHFSYYAFDTFKKNYEIEKKGFIISLKTALMVLESLGSYSLNSLEIIIFFSPFILLFV